MRIRRLSFDMWLCMLIAFGIGYGASFIYEKVVGEQQYEQYLENNQAQLGGIGDVVDENIPKLISTEGLYDGYFTVFFEGWSLYNFNSSTGGSFTEFGYLQVITLESGEEVAIFLDNTNVLEVEEGLYLPIGKFVEYDLTSSQFWTQYAMVSDQMPDVDFGYIDFGGSNLTRSQEDYIHNNSMIVGGIIFLIIFITLRRIGGKLGLFASIFAIDFKKKQEKEQYKLEK
ncbi:MAG: hypothetical protein R3Y54_05540 [Eubacteriales bacterium]